VKVILLNAIEQSLLVLNYKNRIIHNPRPMLHTEDPKTLSRKKAETLKQEQSVPDILKKLKFNIYTGNIRETFGGKLNCTNSGSFYISQGNLSNHSTCFWICDKSLVRNNNCGKIRYKYQDGTQQWVTFVGLEENPAQIIPQGSLVRLSLAHWWWSPDDSEDEERCYLQLSGWY
jgi:hypothetical protein